MPGHDKAVKLLLSAVLLALAVGCGGNGGGQAGEAGTGETTATADQTATATATDGGEAILIKTHATIPTGEVLSGSSIGDSPFCPGGTFSDKHGNDTIGLVDRTFRCPDGSLRIGFTPGHPQGRTQAGPWQVVSGTGAFEGLRGGGQMEIKYERGNSSEGRETFTGTVTR